MLIGGQSAPPGIAAPHLWKPYKLWLGDLWECNGCGHQIVVGALNPVSEHYMPDFDDQVQAMKPKLIVNDC